MYFFLFVFCSFYFSTKIDVGPAAFKLTFRTHNNLLATLDIKHDMIVTTFFVNTFLY